MPLDQFLVVDTIVARIDLAEKVDALLSLCSRDCSVFEFFVEHSNFPQINLIFCLALFLVEIKPVILALRNGFWCLFGSNIYSYGRFLLS